METTDKTIEVLNGLIEINNDRAAGFERASEALEEEDYALKPIFNKLGRDSQTNSAELTALVAQLGGEAHTGTSLSGTMHRAWLGVASVFTGQDRETILSECERGEDAIKAAYQDALAEDVELDPQALATIQAQELLITSGHDLIKSMRDSASAAEERDQTEQDIYDEYDAEHKDDGLPLNQQGYSTSDRLPMPDNNTIISEDESDPQFNYQSSAAGAITSEPDFSYEKTYREGDAAAGANQNSSVSNSKLKEFFVDQLKDLLWAEQTLVDTLPKMADAATTAHLKEAFQSHLSQTQQHVSRLEEIFGMLGEEVDTTKCDAMAGIVDEGEDIIDETDEGSAQRDVGLIFAGQKVEHYEIASYGGMVSLAKTLGYNDAATILGQTLAEEKAADSLLTDIAEHSVNYLAGSETTEEGGLF
jgi:uncharacterized protein (TIGR02284 family)